MHDNNSLNYLGSNPSQLQENLSDTPFMDSLDSKAFDFDFAQPWSNAFYIWDPPLFPPSQESDNTQQEPLFSFVDPASSTGSETLVDKSFSESIVSPISSPSSPKAVQLPDSPTVAKKTRDHACPWPECTHKSTTKRDLDRHIASRHEGKPKKHICRTDPHCPRRLAGWVRKDLRDRHEKIHLRHSVSRTAKRRSDVAGELESDEREVMDGPEAEARREKLLRLPKEDLAARVMKLEDRAASVRGFVALAHRHV